MSEPSFEQSPSATEQQSQIQGDATPHPPPFKDGTGRIWDIAVFIVEALGHVNPAKVKRQGGAQAAEVRKQELIEASMSNHFRRNGGDYRALTMQGQFDRLVKKHADALVTEAKERSWLVVDSECVPQKPPSESGYVEVSLVYDLYASAKTKKFGGIVEALKSALYGHLSAPSPPTTGQSRASESTVARPPAPEDLSLSAGNVLVHSTKGRRKRQLAPLIEIAKRRAADPDNWTSVWDQLVAMAEADVKLPPLLGYKPGEGVWYTADSESEPFGWLTKDAFRTRMGRAKLKNT